jgi:hypothetical protein
MRFSGRELFYLNVLWKLNCILTLRENNAKICSYLNPLEIHVLKYPQNIIPQINKNLN